MKKALSLILITVFLLCSCTDKAAIESEIYPEITSAITTSESTIVQNTETSITKAEEKSEQETTQKSEQSTSADVIEWDDYSSPIYKRYESMSHDERMIFNKADAIKYKTILGVDAPTEASFAVSTYSGSYYLKAYYFADLHSVGYVTETNYPQSFNIIIKGTQMNPDSGYVKTFEGYMDGNMFSKLLVRADDGFVIKSYTITNDFKSYPQRIEDELSAEQIEAGLLKEKLAGMSKEEQEECLREYYSKKPWADYSDQISEDGSYYTLEGGRISIYPMALGEGHEHPGCDNTDAKLMALGQEKLDAAVKIDDLLHGLASTDDTNELPVEGYDEGYFALSEDFGNYDSIMELYKNTFSPEAGIHIGYYSVFRPVELLDGYYAVKMMDINGRITQPSNISEALERSMVVDNGTTYKTIPGIIDTRTVMTKLCGVLNHTATHIEYQLCTMVFDEEGEQLLDEHGISYDRPQVRYEHSVMKLDLIDGKWLITQIRDELQQYVDFAERYGYEF